MANILQTYLDKYGGQSGTTKNTAGMGTHTGSVNQSGNVLANYFSKYGDGTSQAFTGFSSPQQQWENMYQQYVAQYDMQQRAMQSLANTYRNTYEGMKRTNKEASRMTFDPMYAGYVTDDVSAANMNTNPNYGKRVSDEDLAEKYRQWQEAEAKANETRSVGDYWKSMYKFHNDADKVVADYDKRIAAMEADPNLKREAFVSGSGNRDVEALKAERDAFIQTNTQYKNAAEDYTAILEWAENNPADVASYKRAKEVYDAADAKVKELEGLRDASKGPEIHALGAEGGIRSATTEYDEDISAAIRERDRAKAVMDYAYANRYADLLKSEDVDVTADKGKEAFESFLEEQASNRAAVNARIESNLNDDWASTDRTEEGEEEEYVSPYDFSIYDPNYSSNYADQNENWSDDEKRTFYYLFASNREAAFRYGNEVNQRYASEEESSKQLARHEWLERDAGHAVLASLATIPANILAGADYIRMLEENKVRGGVYESQYGGFHNYSNDVRGYVGSELNRYGTISDSFPFLGGKGWGDAYQLLMSMGDSAVAVAAGGGVANAVFFGSAAASATTDALERGLAPDKALAFGFASGLAEVAGETFSVENLLRKDTLIRKGLAAAIMQQGLTEGSEEMVTTLINTFADALINGDKRELQQKIDSLADSGMSYEDAKKRAWLEWAEELGVDAIGGLLSGSLMSAVHSGMAVADMSNREYSGDAQALFDLAELTDEGSESRALADRYKDEFDAYKAALEAQDSDTGTQTVQEPTGRQNKDARLETEADKRSQDETQIVQEQSAEAVQDEATQGQERVAQTEEKAAEKPTPKAEPRTGISALKGARLETALAKDLGAKDRTVLEEKATARLTDLGVENAGKAASAVVDRVLGSEKGAIGRAVSGLNFNDSRVRIVLQELTEQLAGQKTSASWLGNTELMTVGQNNAWTRTIENGLKQVRVNGSSERSKVTGATMVDGKLNLTVEQGGKSRTLSQDQLDLSDSQQRALGLLTRVLGDDAANAYDGMTIGNMGDVLQVMRYASAFGTVRDVLGRAGVKDDAALASPLRKGLTDAQVLRALAAGRKLGPVPEGQRVKSRRGTGAVSLEGGTLDGRKLGGVKNRETVTNSQRYKTIKRLAEELGIDVVLYESDVADDKGNLEDAPHGAYKDGVIWLDWNAGVYNVNKFNNKKGVRDYSSEAEALIFLTMSHELTHFLEQNAEKEYNELHDFITQYMAETGKDFNGMVRRKLAEQSNIDHDEAVREVIADACQTMLVDSKYVEQLINEKPTLWERIRDWIRNFFGFAKTQAKGPEFEAIRDVAAQISEIWDRALQVAVESRLSEETLQQTPTIKEQAAANILTREQQQAILDEAMSRGVRTDRLADLYRQRETVRNTPSQQTPLMLPAHEYTAKEKAAVKRRFSKAVEELMDSYLFDGVDLSREQAEQMVREYAAAHDGYFSLMDEAKQTGRNKTRKQMAEAERDAQEGGKEQLSSRTNLGYHAGDLGKAEHLNIQGRYRGTGHFGTGTYFVGEEDKVTKDSHYGKRPQHAVDFTDYNLFKVHNDRDGYRLHDFLRIIDGGIKQDWILPALDNQFNIVSPTGYYDLAKSKYGEDWVYGDNLLNAMLEYAADNGISIKTLDEYKADEGKGLDDSDAKDYYEEYVKDTVKEEIDSVNAEYRKFMDALFDVRYFPGFTRAKLFSALTAVAEYQAVTPRNARVDSYATVFMKAMGYEGVDVRGTRLDNTEYGSVIYDVKPETVQYSPRTQDLSDIEKRAVDQFGTTTDFSEAGYILSDGRMLRFSDNKHAGMREYDHRAIGRAFGANIDLNKNHGFDENSGKYLEQFVDAGNIRIEVGDPDLDMDAGIQLSADVPLTTAQEQTIRDFIEWKNQRDASFQGDEYSLYSGPLALHIDFGGNAELAVFASAHDMNTWGVKNLSYEGGQINADRVIQDIRHYYRTGETRTPSVVAQFHSQYSARTGDSEQFKAWFGNSKIVNPDGTPRVSFHSTNAKNINVFQSGNSAGIIYFAFSEKDAKAAARGKKYVRPYYLSVQNPVNTENTPINWYDAEDSSKVNRWRQDGYDAVYVKDEAGVSIAVFSPYQIKSADENIGTFDRNNPDVRYSARTGDKSDMDLLLEAPENTLTDAEQKARAAYRAQVDGYRSRQQAVVTLIDAMDKAVRDGDATAATKLRAKLTEAEKKMAQALAGLTEAERGPELREILRREREIQRRRTDSRIRESYGRRELRQKVDRLWKDLTKRLSSPSEKKNIPVNVMMQAVDVLEAINMDATRADSKAGQKLRDRLNELKSRYNALKNDPDFRQAAMYDPQVAEFLDNMIETVGDTPINRMSAQQLAAVYNTLKALDHVARSALKVRLRTMEYSAYDISKRMTEETRSVGKQKAGAIDMFLNASLSPARMFNRLGGYHKDSTWSQVYEMLNEGQLRQTQLQVEGSMLFEDLLAAKDYGKFVDPKNTVDVGLKDADGKTIEITHGMLVSLYMHLMNEQNRRHVAYGGLTIPGLTDYYNGKKIKGTENAKSAAGVLQEIAEINDKIRETDDPALKEALEAERDAAAEKAMSYLEELQKAVEGKLTEYDRKWIAACRELFDGFSKRALNEATMQVYGIKRANVENYFPIWVDGNFLNTPFESVAKDFSLENAGFMKERVDSAKPIRLADVSDVAASQIRKVAQYAGLMPVIHDFNKIWGKTQTGYRDSVRQAVMQTYGQSGVNYIENLMADLNGARGMENSPLGEMLNRLRGHMAQASLTLSLRTAMGQAASYPTAASVLGWEPLAKALAHGGKNNTVISRADQELILKWSPLLKYRLQGYRDPELGQIAQMNSKFDRVWKKARWATGWIQAADGATVGRLWYACEYYVQDHNKALKKGTDAYYEAVAKKFNEVVELTQPNYTTMQRPDILRNPNALVRQLTMFLTQRLQNFNIMYDAAATYSQMRKDRAAGKYGVTNEDVRQAGIRTRTAALSQITAAATIVAFKFLADMILHSMNAYRDDDDELTKESISAELLDMFLDSLAGNVLGGGELYDLIESKAFGKTYYGIEVSGVSTVTDALKAVNDFYDKVAKGEVSWKEADKLAKKISVIAGIPYANAEKIIRGGIWHVQDMINGEFGSFEAGVDRTTGQQAHRLWRAYDAKDFAQAKKIREEVGDDDKLNQALAAYIKKQYADGKINKFEAQRQLEKYAGKDKETAEKTMREYSSEVETGIKFSQIEDSFLLGDITAQKAQQMLVKYGGLDAQTAKMKVDFWGYQNKNPGTKLEFSSYKTYVSKYQGIGLTVAQYESYSERLKDCKGVDADGDGKTDSGSKKAEVLKLIDSMSLTPTQKDQLYFANNYGASGLKDTPWHK